MALALQQAAEAHSGAQAVAGAEVFGDALKDAVVNGDRVVVELRTNPLTGRPELSISTGPLRLFVPQAAPAAEARPELAGVDVPVDLAPYASHEPPTVAPHASSATGAMAHGRELVYGQPHPTTGPSGAQPQSLIPTRTGDRPLSREAGHARPETANRATSHPGASRPETGPARALQGALSLPAAPIDRVPPAVQQLLTHLQLLPPGARNEEVLPRLSEVIRAWHHEALRPSDLPPDTVRAVNHLLASAVLSVALADPQAQVPAPRSESLPNPRAETQGGTQAHPLFAAEAPTRLPLSSARIAEAVVNLLSRAHLQAAQTPLQARLPAQPLPQTHRTPSLGPAGNPLGTSGTHAERTPPALRPEALVRPETLGRSQTREEARQARVIVSPETERIEREGERHPQVVVEPTYEREPQRDPAYASEATLEALWPDLHQDLRAGGFLDNLNGSIRVLQSTDEGRALLNLVASRTPAGFDPIDLLELIGQKIGWGERGSPVNEAFARLAGYRGLSDRTKAGALLEPLRDVIVILGMGHEGLAGTEISLLSRFEAHLPVAEMFLENEAWFDRLENKTSDSRATLESEMEEARNLYVDYLARQHGMRNLFNAPPAPQLVN